MFKKHLSFYVNAGLQEQKFYRNLAKMVQATVLAQVFVFALAPIMTRLYTPEDYYLWGIFSALLQVLASICTLKLDWLLPNAFTKAGAFTDLMLGMFTVLVVCVLILGGIALQLPLLTLWDGYEELGILTFLLPLGVFVAGGLQMMRAWFVREGNLAPVSHGKILQTLSNGVLGIILGLTAFGGAGLVSALLASSIVNFGYLILKMEVPLRNIRKFAANSFLKRGAKKAHLMGISTTVSFCQTLAESGLIILLAQVAGQVEVGLFALVYRLMAAPVAIISASLAESFWSYSIDLKKNNGLSHLKGKYIQITKRLALAALAICFGFYILSFFIETIFGSNWVGASDILLMMIPMIFGMIVFSPTNHLIIFEKQHLQIASDLLKILLFCSCAYLYFSIDFEFKYLVLLISVSSMIGHLTLFLLHLLLYRQLKKD